MNIYYSILEAFWWHTQRKAHITNKLPNERLEEIAQWFMQVLCLRHLHQQAEQCCGKRKKWGKEKKLANELQSPKKFEDIHSFNLKDQPRNFSELQSSSLKAVEKIQDSRRENKHVDMKCDRTGHKVPKENFLTSKAKP